MPETTKRPRMSEQSYRTLLDLAERVGWAEILAVAEDTAADLAISAERAGHDDEIVASYNRAAGFAGRAWVAFANGQGRQLAAGPTPSTPPPPEPGGDELTDAEVAELDALPSVAQPRPARTLADVLHEGQLTPKGAIAALEPDAWEAQPC